MTKGRRTRPDRDMQQDIARELGGAARTACLAVSVDRQRHFWSSGGDRHSVFRIASLTKPVTAVATVRAARQRGIDLATPVIEVLPELEPHWRADRSVTVGHLLGQVSGLTPSVTAGDVAALGPGDDAALRSARLVVAAGSTRPPGARWEYYNGNYFLAGAVLAALRGTTYERALDDLVLAPWGMGDTGFDPPPGRLVSGVDGGRDVPGVPYPRGRRPSGGLCSSAADLLGFAEHLLGDPLLDEVARPRTRQDDPMTYGLGWAVGPSGQLYLNGRLRGYRAAMLLSPPHGLAAVVLTNDTDALPAAAAALNRLQIGFTGDDLTGAVRDFAA